MADEENNNKDEEQTEEEQEEETTEEETENEEEQEEAEDNEESTDDAGEAMGEDVDVPEKFEDIVEEIEVMPVIELNELVKLLEKKWGVSAQAVAAAGGGGDEEEEKDAYDVSLEDFGDSKIGVIKVVKAELGLGLKEAKGLVEDAPVVLKEGVATEDAEEMKEKLEEAGATVELK